MVETVGEYVASQLPVVAQGAFVDAGGYRLTVVEMRGRRLHRLRGERPPQKPSLYGSSTTEKM